MSTLGSIIAGIAVAAGGVFLGRKLERIKAALDTDTDADEKATYQSPNKIIDAERDPVTGSYRQKKK